MFEYAGYSLDDGSRFDLSDKDRLYLDAIIWIVDNRDSVRGASRNCGVARSSLSAYINKRLRRVSNELYGVVKQIIVTNKRRLCRRRL